MFLKKGKKKKEKKITPEQKKMHCTADHQNCVGLFSAVVCN